MLDTKHMWLALAALAAIVFAFDWARRSPANPTGEQTAVMMIAEGGKLTTRTVDRTQCLAQRDRVWAATDHGTECIAYLTPEGGVSGSTAILFFEGDVEDQSAENAARMVAIYSRIASQMQARYDVPVIVIGRPGLMGSTGNHLLGGRRDEGEILNEAVDAVKKKFSLSRLVIAGQSGGARVAAQLLVLGRTDVVCAAMGSGAYGVPNTSSGKVRTNIFGEPGQKYLVPLHQADRIAPSRERRLFVIGDPLDRRTPFDEQREWAQALQAHGHHAVLHDANGSGPERHGLSHVAMHVAGMCASGKSDAEIAAFVAKQRTDTKAP
jgi:pimeloyl-ACP methyl ester carboxylesterase